MREALGEESLTITDQGAAVASFFQGERDRGAR
jgi:hypothetical protein